MSDLHWQRRWDPFQELQREMGACLRILVRCIRTGKCIDIPR